MLPLPFGSKHEEVPVLGEHDSAKIQSPLQKTVILPVGSSVLLGGKHVDLPLPQATSNRRRHMVVQIVREAHVESPDRPSFARITD